jgi:hypothetical protein
MPVSGLFVFTAPVLADLDADGDLDALLGSSGGLFRISYYENTGTAAAPAFASPIGNPFGLSEPWPAVGDLDGDGDFDVFVGDFLTNRLRYFQNTGTPAAPAFTEVTMGSFGLLTDVGVRAAPAFVDIDADGDEDAFFGEALTDGFFGASDGAIHFLENTGTAVNPVFAPVVVGPFGLLTVFSNSVPTFADIDADGDLDAFVGAEDGSVYFFRGWLARCPAVPGLGCTTGFASARLVVDERVPGKERLTVKLSRGPQIAAAAFGDPTTVGPKALNVCVYDDQGTLAGAVDIHQEGFPCGAAACWKQSRNLQTYIFADGKVLRHGVASVKLRGGDAGKSLISLSGRNNAAKGKTDLSTGIAPALTTTSSATVQLIVSETGECFSATLGGVKLQIPSYFLAR